MVKGFSCGTKVNGYRRCVFVKTHDTGDNLILKALSRPGFRVVVCRRCGFAKSERIHETLSGRGKGGRFATRLVP